MSIIPSLAELPAAPKRIILHWTAGGPEPTSHDLKSYHYLVSQGGEPFMGVEVAANMRQIRPGTPTSEYAAHTRGMNSFSVGVALCGMSQAIEGGPFGPYPIQRAQVDAFAAFVAELCHEWDLLPTVGTVFSHYEAQSIHGVPQEKKWDITVLPWLPRLMKSEVGDFLRLLVRGSPLPRSSDADR